MTEDLFSRLADEDADADFPIERGVPITADRSSGQRTKWDIVRLKLRLARLEVGDCITVRPPEGEELIYTQNAVSGAACSFSRAFAKDNPGQPPRSFTTRQQGGRFVRCWRTA
jgi:hypothetical protein